ncbi:uncharacterized protein LOC114544607 [Dendronephthya gigantea]|uniref:uncharacterized protein LOC114544607 n=2 Tax=Dendronephthya gigantea TaxID=151771 RepID=UPI001068FF09|nr:uncharacterized protein LOC114544607 [Dendronephthya gigantea]
MSSEDQSAENQSSSSATITSALINQFKSYLDSKIDSLLSGLSIVNSSQTKKLERQAEGRALKFPGNKDQFLFNAEVHDLLDESVVLIKKQDTDSALPKIEAAENLILQRQKKIKLADKSETGWLAVKEYEAEELASDSDDEKRIKKAQELALKKRRNNAIKKDKARKSSYPPYSCADADKRFFRGIYCPFFVSSGRRVLARSLPSVCV